MTRAMLLANTVQAAEAAISQSFLGARFTASTLIRRFSAVNMMF